MFESAEERGDAWHLTTEPSQLRALLVELRPHFDYRMT